MNWLEKTAMVIVTLFAPIQMILAVTVGLVLADLLTGLIASKKRGEWESLNDIKSSGLRRTVTKLTVYLFANCLGFLVEKYMLADFVLFGLKILDYFPLGKIIPAIIAMTETKSILENLDTINGSPVFKVLIQKLGSVNDKLKDEVKKDLDQ
jgi:phage-related holin